jgi:ABC-type multidrug transport system fused ATPase/permease subunit
VAAELTPATGFAARDEREKVSVWQLFGSAQGLQGTIAQVLVLSITLEIFAIASPFFVQIVVDRVVVGRDEDLLTVLGIGFGLLALMQVAVTAVRGWLGVYLSTMLNVRLLDALFGQLLRLPLAWFEKRHIGDIVSRFRSVDAIQRTFSVTFLETLIDGAMVVLTLGVMLWYSAVLAAVVLAAALVYGATRWMFYGAQRRALDEQLVHEGKAGTHFIETLRGMMAIKLNLRERERRSAYQNLVIDQTNAGVLVQRLAILHRAANGVIFGLENVYSITPSFRAEKSRTPRHLTEFQHLEVELAWCDLDQLLRFTERMFTEVVHAVAKKRPAELTQLGRPPQELLDIEAPFPRLTYRAAIEQLRSKGFPVEFGSDAELALPRKTLCEHATILLSDLSSPSIDSL